MEQWKDLPVQTNSGLKVPFLTIREKRSLYSQNIMKFSLFDPAVK